MLNEAITRYQQRVDEQLRHFINAQDDTEPQLKAAMKHGALIGGKRIRPFLVYAIGEMLNVPLERLDACAAAIECIHAYSLIHDDLPAMDDDALRRGQPTVHIAFNEATAILAGDALQTLAFEIISREEMSQPPRALEGQRWAGAVDTVGSTMLARVLAETQYGGCVAACGLAGGADLPTTVMPFILRNVSLRGVDSVMCPVERRKQAWQRLVTDLPAEERLEGTLAAHAVAAWAGAYVVRVHDVGAHRRALAVVDAFFSALVDQIGPIAKPRKVWIVPDMPKTRSGKIMRRVLGALSNSKDVGDVMTLANPEIVEEIKRFKAAVKKANDEIREIIDNTPEELRDHVNILEAQKLLLKDKMLYGRALETIETDRVNAEWALKTVVGQIKSMFQSMEDQYLKERVSDIIHVSDRIMHYLTGADTIKISDIDKRVILVARDLSPADTSQIQLERIKGFLTDVGGKTSHTGIIARTLDIPAVLGLVNATALIRNDDILIVDGNDGVVIINPDDKTLVEYEERQERYQAYRSRITRESHLPARTADISPGTPRTESERNTTGSMNSSPTRR